MRFKVMLILTASVLIGCEPPRTPTSASGVHQKTFKIHPGSDGLTNEQRNIRDRLLMDNSVGSVKHLYVVSAYSGQVLIYSTVRGKVTSSGKRLTPTSVSQRYTGTGTLTSGVPVEIGGEHYATQEVIQDDGTYGSSIEYLYWFSSDGRYHQHYLSGGQILHISDQPVHVKDVVLNLEVTAQARTEK